MTLYLKYRPKSIAELDLVDVRETLSKMLKSRDMPHAWLFSGPRGTGKTSAARVLAKVVNNDEAVLTSPDVIEVDAASNRGIDEIRTLREGVGLAPLSAKYKVYIIDEVHMLTTEAANALLKTLEEPPKHVVFVLCTTDPQKLPETVVSRCTQVQFRKPSMGEAVASLTKVAKGEKLKVTEEDLKLIATAARGSFRDGTKILEQVALTKASVKEILGMVNGAEPERFMELVSGQNTKEALELINVIVGQGVSVRSFIERCILYLRDKLLVDGDKSVVRWIEELTRVYVQTREAVVEQLPLEIFVVENTGVVQVKPQVQAPKENPSIKTQFSTPIAAPQPIVEPKKEIKSGSYSVDDVILKWKDVLQAVKPKNHSVEALLRSTRPAEFDGQVLSLEVFYQFHKDKLESERCRQIVEEAVAGVFGTDKVIVRLEMAPKKTNGGGEDIIKVAEDIFK